LFRAGQIVDGVSVQPGCAAQCYACGYYEEQQHNQAKQHQPTPVAGLSNALARFSASSFTDNMGY
jgi:hypothetical protein